jgi:hypothetical protein
VFGKIGYFRVLIKFPLREGCCTSLVLLLLVVYALLLSLFSFFRLFFEMSDAFTILLLAEIMLRLFLSSSRFVHETMLRIFSL